MLSSKRNIIYHPVNSSEECLVQGEDVSQNKFQATKAYQIFLFRISIVVILLFNIVVILGISFGYIRFLLPQLQDLPPKCKLFLDFSVNDSQLTMSSGYKYGADFCCRLSLVVN